MKKLTKAYNYIVNSKWAMLAVCFLAGNFGVHRFLQKRWITGILMVLLSFIGLSGIWTLIDFILIATGKLGVKTAKQKRTTVNATL